MRDEKKLYIVAETKNTGTGTVRLSKFHIDAQLKIKCAKTRFDEFGKVEYKVRNSGSGLVD